MDIRPAELEQIRVVAEFICQNYPELFELEGYTHPVKGACTSLVLLTKSSARIDLVNVKEIRFNFSVNWITIFTTMPDKTYIFDKFIKDETVM